MGWGCTEATKSRNSDFVYESMILENNFEDGKVLEHPNYS